MLPRVKVDRRDYRVFDAKEYRLNRGAEFVYAVLPESDWDFSAD